MGRRTWWVLGAIAVVLAGCHSIQGVRTEGVAARALAVSSHPDAAVVVHLTRWSSDVGTHGEVELVRDGGIEYGFAQRGPLAGVVLREELPSYDESYPGHHGQALLFAPYRLEPAGPMGELRDATTGRALHPAAPVDERSRGVPTQDGPYTLRVTGGALTFAPEGGPEGDGEDLTPGLRAALGAADVTPAAVTHLAASPDMSRVVAIVRLDEPADTTSVALALLVPGGEGGWSVEGAVELEGARAKRAGGEPLSNMRDPQAMDAQLATLHAVHADAQGFRVWTARPTPRQRATLGWGPSDGTLGVYDVSVCRVTFDDELDPMDEACVTLDRGGER